MKYWRGYLVAAIFTGIALALANFAQNNAELIDMVYPYITRLIQSYLVDWSSGVSFCLWQVLLAAGGVLVLALIVMMIVARWNPVQCIGWVTAVFSFVFMLHTGLYSLNYHAGPLASDIRMDMSESITISQLVDAAHYYRDEANKLSGQVHRNPDGSVRYDSFEALAKQAGDGFHSLTYDKAISVFAGSTVPVKELGNADDFTAAGVTGITVAITGESAVNPQIPTVQLPFAMCHEMAHRMSIVDDADADLAAFLACDANADIQFRYSAYFMAYYHCYSALNAETTSMAQSAIKDLRSGMNAQLAFDLDQVERFWAEHLDPDEVADANDFHDAIRSSVGIDVESETEGFSQEHISGLLTAWHLHSVVLPSQDVEEEAPFDPYNPPHLQPENAA